MRRRPLGKTGMESSELVLGTWGLSGDGYGPVPESEQDRVIVRARALGLTLFETSDSYGGGAMEQRLGRLLGDDHSVHIVTKVGTDRDAVPPRKRFQRNYLRDAVARSGERLRRNPVDVVLLHNPSLGAVERGEAAETLDELTSQGCIRAWGVSAGSADIARAALARGARVVSLAHNAFWSRDVQEVAADLVRRGAGLLAHSVLAYGLLTGLWSPDKQFASDDHRSERWTADDLRLRLRQLEALTPLVAGPVASLRAAAVRYVLADARVSAAIIGPRSAIQLDQLVRDAGKGPPYLPHEALTAFASRLRSLGMVG